MLISGWCFFFSSRRRHTRLQGDWSSDVCSSDLAGRLGIARVESELEDLAFQVLEPEQYTWVHEQVEAERSEEHTSELQSPCNLVCRLLLEKKKKRRLQLTPRER